MEIRATCHEGISFIPTRIFFDIGDNLEINFDCDFNKCPHGEECENRGVTIKIPLLGILPEVKE